MLQRPGVTLHTHTVATNMAESGINIAKHSTMEEKVSKKGVSRVVWRRFFIKVVTKSGNTTYFTSGTEAAVGL